jgi:microcystin-dependent protein
MRRHKGKMKMQINKLRALCVVLLIATAAVPAAANQSSGCLPTSSLPGLTLINTINAWMKSISTMFSGSSAPVTDCSAVTLTGQLWLDNATSGYLKQKLYDGTSSVETGRYDTTNHWWVPPVGGGTATLASATTTDLGSVPQAYVTVTGTTPITGLGSSAVIGTIHAVTFSGALTLTYDGTGLILPTAANIITAPGDVGWFVYLGSGNWKCLNYQTAGGTALLPLPSGNISYTAGSSVPSGWLPCDGAAVSRTTYASLFADIGIAYGSGNGTTTFNVPDVGGRVIAGEEATATRLTSAVSGVDGGTLGAAGGDQAMQQHTHTGSVTVSINGYIGANLSEGFSHDSVPPGVQAPNTYNNPTATTSSFTTDATGTGHAQNVQPTIIMKCLIKTEIPALTNYAELSPHIKVPLALVGFNFERVGKDVKISAEIMGEIDEPANDNGVRIQSKVG